jgi:hypothetical protein
MKEEKELKAKRNALKALLDKKTAQAAERDRLESMAVECEAAALTIERDGDPEDAAAVARVSSLRTQAKMAENKATRLDREMNLLSDPIREATNELRGACMAYSFVARDAVFQVSRAAVAKCAVFENDPAAIEGAAACAPSVNRAFGLSKQTEGFFTDNPNAGIELANALLALK